MPHKAVRLGPANPTTEFGDLPLRDLSHERGGAAPGRERGHLKRRGAAASAEARAGSR